MRAQPSDLRVFKWVKSMMFIFHDNMVSGRDNDNDAGGKCDKSRWQSGWKENKGVVPSMMRMLTKKSMIKIIVALIIDNFDNFDYFDFQLLLGWVWVAREQILRRARWFLLCLMFFSIISMYLRNFSICYPNWFECLLLSIQVPGDCTWGALESSISETFSL